LSLGIQFCQYIGRDRNVSLKVCFTEKANNVLIIRFDNNPRLIEIELAFDYPVKKL
jgi:hypothetical protein